MAKPRGRPFQKGHKFAKGGFRPGAGSKPDWFKAKMREIASHKQAIQFLQDCVLGEPVDEFITQQGECIPHRAKAETRIKAWEAVADRGYGRPTQAVEMAGELTVNMIEAIKQLREKRGLPLQPPS